MRKSFSVLYQPVISPNLDLQDPYVQAILDNRVGCVDTTYFNNSICWKDVENIKSSLQGNPPVARSTVNWLVDATNTIQIKTTDFSKSDNKIPATPFSTDVKTMQPICTLQFVPISTTHWTFNFSFDYRSVDVETLDYVNNLYSGTNTSVSLSLNNVEIYQIDIIEPFRLYTNQCNFEWNQVDTLTFGLTDITLEEISSQQQIIYKLETL